MQMNEYDGHDELVKGRTSSLVSSFFSFFSAFSFLKDANSLAKKLCLEGDEGVSAGVSVVAGVASATGSVAVGSVAGTAADMIRLERVSRVREGHGKNRLTCALRKEEGEVGDGGGTKGR